MDGAPENGETDSSVAERPADMTDLNGLFVILRAILNDVLDDFMRKWDDCWWGHDRSMASGGR